MGQGTTADEIVRAEHQGQGAMNVTVRNVITSMRLISAVDWAEFFESVSHVDAVLRADSDFAAMDFPTRDRYRDAIEELARGSGTPRSMSPGLQSRPPSGLRLRARTVTAQRPAASMIQATTSSLKDVLPSSRSSDFGPDSRLDGSRQRRGRNPGLSRTIAIVSALILVLPLLALVNPAHWRNDVPGSRDARRHPRNGRGGVAGEPRRHDLYRTGHPARPGLHDGVPAALRTIVVVPTLLTAQAEIEEQVERLEVHYLASQDGDFRFALLSDWTDSATENAPGDDELLGPAVAAIARLNERHGAAPDGARFLLFHRRRIWNEAEGKWMGWERKRGKLHELNRLLRGATDTTFVAIGDKPLPYQPWSAT